MKRSRSWTSGDSTENILLKIEKGSTKRQRRHGIRVEKNEVKSAADRFADTSGSQRCPVVQEDEDEASEVKLYQNVAKKEKELEVLFECPVCRQLLLNPVTLLCGHSLCEECMIKYLERGTGRCRCPAGCQTEIPFYLPPVNVTLRRVLEKKYPSLLDERKADKDDVFMRRRRIENAAAITPLLQQGTEGRHLESVRRDIHMLRLQDRELVRENDLRRAERELPDNRERGGLRHPIRLFKLPCTTIWIVTLSMCTLWTLYDREAGERLGLDWEDVVTKREIWRLVTTFTTLGDDSILWKSIFSLLRLHFLKNYEPYIGTGSYLITLCSGICILLLHSFCCSFLFGNQSEEKEFLSHHLIWFVFIDYCFWKPLLFLVLLFIAHLESFLQSSLFNSRVFGLMLLPKMIYMLWIVRQCGPEFFRRRNLRRAHHPNAGIRIQVGRLR